ncbi:MAG: hypothetical protein EOP77_05425 [Variovorax sp.]|nr:MAG: hypothetical protein EOP77_05425 [Variovorax sp.]
MSSLSNYFAELSPLRKLLLAVLLAIVLAQAAAMTLLVRSQVQKAELREAMESSAARSVASRSVERPEGVSQAMQVRYVSSR